MKIGIYCRVSSKSQEDNYSLDYQYDNGKKYCIDNGYEYELFSESESGVNKDRKELGKVFNRIRSGDLDGIMFFNWDRFNRGDEETKIKFLRLVVETKCKIVVDNRERDIIESFPDLMEFEFGMFQGKMNRYSILKNTSNGILKCLENGKVRGMRKLGYNKKNGILTINEDEKPIVEDIFKFFLHKKCNTKRYLIDKVNSKHNTNYSMVNIKRFLVYKGYTGIHTQKYTHPISKVTHTFETKIPEIIDEKTFNQVQDKLKKIEGMRLGRDKKGFDYLMKGLVFCNDCGSKMYKYGTNSKNKNGIPYYYYSCSSKTYKPHYWSDERWKEVGDKCLSYRRNTINFSLIDEVVWEFLFDFLRDSKSVQDSYKKQYENGMVLKSKFSGKKKYYEKQIKEVDEKKGDILEKVYYNNEMSKEEKDILFKRLDEKKLSYIKRLNEIQIDSIDYDNKEIIKDFQSFINKDLDRKYNMKSFKDRRNLILQYINRIEVKRKNDMEYLFEVDFKFIFDSNNTSKFMNYVKSIHNRNFYIKNRKS
tara:strand:- start:43 stop:1641 length:1599 start_codon:yes stop_codon:yes gene_type:complete